MVEREKINFMFGSVIREQNGWRVIAILKSKSLCSTRRLHFAEKQKALEYFIKLTQKREAQNELR